MKSYIQVFDISRMHNPKFGPNYVILEVEPNYVISGFKLDTNDMNDMEIAVQLKDMGFDYFFSSSVNNYTLHIPFERLEEVVRLTEHFPNKFSYYQIFGKADFKLKVLLASYK